MTQTLKTILYVDDEPDIRAIVQMALELTPELEVRTAASGEQAIEAARSLRPDLALLDVMMPGLDGPGTFMRMRADPELSAIPVIFVTAKAMPEEIERFRKMGAIGVIAKPFDPMQLSAQATALWEARDSGSASLQPQRPQPAAARSVTHTAHEPAVRRMQEQSASLATKFLVRTRDELATLPRLIAQCQTGARGALAEIEYLMHRIRGTGATLGFDQLSECAGSLEQAARQSVASGTTPLCVRELQELAERLAREVEAAATLT